MPFWDKQVQQLQDMLKDDISDQTLKNMAEDTSNYTDNQKDAIKAELERRGLTDK